MGSWPLFSAFLFFELMLHGARVIPPGRRPTCTFLPRHGRSGGDGVDATSSRAPFLVLRPSFPRFFTTEKSPERARALTLIQPIPKTLSHTKSARVRALFFLFRFMRACARAPMPSYYMHILVKHVRAPTG